MPRHALALQLMALVLVGCSMENRDLTLAVSTEEPAPAIAESIQSFLAERGISVSMDIATNPERVLTAVRNREVDLALLEEPNQPTPGIVTLAPLYPSVLHVLHNRAEDPRDLADLIRGSKVYAGPPGGAADRLLLQLTADFGVANEEYELLDNPWTVSPDVYFIFGGLLSDDSVRQLAGYRLFSFADMTDISGGTVADGIVLKHHHLKPFLLPESIYYTLNDAPVLTLSIRSVLITHEEFDDELAFDIASALFNNAQEIALNYPLVVRELNIDLNAVELMFPLHSGSRRFLDRDKPGFIERYVEILALVFTIVITLVSGTVALYRHRQQVKKDRVDVYYSQLLDIRNNIEQASTHDELRSSRKRALDVQREVVDLVIDERLAADTSLMAFLSLSNQIINELDQRLDRH